MSEKSVNKKKTKHFWVSIAVIFVMLPVLLVISKYFGNRKYYLCSILLIVLAMVPFLLSFEQRRPQAREIVTLAVMCAIAVASRAAFIMVPHFKPLVGIVMITGMAFGAEAGFLTGAVSGFVSNFLFGQGPWTPWQMFAFGIAGFLAGVFAKAGFLKGEKRIRAASVWRDCRIWYRRTAFGCLYVVYDEQCHYKRNSCSSVSFRNVC